MLIYIPLSRDREASNDLKKNFYVVLVSRDADGALNKTSVPLQVVYLVAAVALIGLFTVAGLAGSYSRMLLKTAKFNQMRMERESLRRDYATLQKREHEKEVQAASLGALASEVSALYGLTANRLSLPGAAAGSRARSAAAVMVPAALPVAAASADAAFSNASYYKSLDAFYALRSSAMSGSATRAITGQFARSPLRPFDEPVELSGVHMPSLWPVMGPITSPFGGREDPILGAGEGEFHKGVDISAPFGTPIRATGDGVVETAAVGHGYGKQIVIDHGNGVKTAYAHMSGFHVEPGQHVVRGEVIGYVGLTGRTTGAHCHYEVRVRDVAVNPHRYMRQTINDVSVAGL